jgi:5-hydroxyisourate hydrolase-like protein (transthyretin family)
VGIVESKAQLKERLVAISRPGKSWKWAALAAFVLIAGLGLTRAQTEKTARDQSSAWTVSGHVLDSETKAPVANFSVTPVQTNDLNGSALSLQHNVDGHNGSYQIDISNRIAQQLRVEAKGYLPESKLLVPDATDVDFLLSKDGSSGTVVMPEISGRIVDQRGEPVSGVQVAVVNSNLTVDLGIGKSRLFNRQFPHIYGEPRLANLPWNYCTTDARGRFYLDDLDGAFHLIAANEKGFAEIPTNQFSANMTITLEPWGRIEGTLRNYDEVGSNDVVFLGYTFNTFYDQFRKIDPEYAEKLPHLWYPDRPNTIRSTYETGTDEHGHYSFDFVRPGQYEVFGSDVRERAMINANDATVKNIGGQGRPLIGIFKIRNPYVNIAWDRVGSRLGGDGFCYFCSVPHMPATPFKSRQDYLAWRERRDVDRTLDKNGHGHRVRIAKDGSFRIDQVESGQYEMELFLRDPKHRVNWDFPVAETNLLAEYDGFDRTFDIPSSEPNNREPLDLGVIEISLKAQETPDAAAQTNRLSPAGNISPPESTMLRGTVVLPDGTPAANAEVGLKIAGQSLKVADRELVAESGSQAVTRTVAQGAFTLPMRDMATALCAVHDAGFAKLSRKELTNGVKIMLQPWGRVEGVLRLNQHPAASETVELNNYVADSWDFTSRIRTDAEGRFVFDHVPAGDCQLLRCVPFGNGWRTCCPIHFQVRPGETTNLSWGGNGRPVVGKCVVENVDNLPHNLRLKVSIHTPDQLTSPPPELTNPRQMVEWTHSEAGQKARNESRFFGATAKSDGSFQVDDVSPGEYELSFEFEDVPLPNSISGTVRMLSSQPQRIVIPPLSNPENCEPFDLGTVVPSFREALLFTAVRDGLKAGQTAPPLETKTLSGQPLRLTDYRGKYVLVDLEDTFPGSETEAIQAVNETFSQDDRLVIITLSEKEDESFVKYLSGKRYTRWVLGDMGFERYAQPYQMASGQLPMILLIDPQGNIVATRLRGQAIQSAVAKALARK